MMMFERMNLKECCNMFMKKNEKKIEKQMYT